MIEIGIRGADAGLVAAHGACGAQMPPRFAAPAQMAALAINAGGDPARFAGFALPGLPDPVPDRRRPLAGVLAVVLAGVLAGGKA